MSGWIQREAEQAEEAAEFADADLRAAEEWRARALAAEAALASVGAAAQALDGCEWPPPAVPREAWDAMHPAEKVVRDALGTWRDLAAKWRGEAERDAATHAKATDALVAEVLRVRAERDEANAARDALRERAAEEIGLRLDGHGDDDLAAEAGEVRRERDEARRLLAAAARGELPRCGCGRCGRLATRSARTQAPAPICDECHVEDVRRGWTTDAEWRDLPHAAALRAAIGSASSEAPDATLTVRPAATQAERDRDLLSALAGALLVERAVAAEYAASEGRPWAERIAVKARLDAAREAVRARMAEGGR